MNMKLYAKVGAGDPVAVDQLYVKDKSGEFLAVDPSGLGGDRHPMESLATAMAAMYTSSIEAHRESTAMLLTTVQDSRNFYLAMTAHVSEMTSEVMAAQSGLITEAMNQYVSQIGRGSGSAGDIDRISAALKIGGALIPALIPSLGTAESEIARARELAQRVGLELDLSNCTTIEELDDRILSVVSKLSQEDQKNVLSRLEQADLIWLSAVRSRYGKRQAQAQTQTA